MSNQESLITVTLRLPISLAERAKHLAQIQDKTIAEVFSELLQDAEVETQHQ